MPWFKVDDGFHGHPKVVDASLEAIGLWTVAGSWCAKYLTDGFVPEKTVLRLGGDVDSAGELVRAELWSFADDGYQFKDWEDYQPLKADVEAERAAAQERMKKVRAAKKGVRPNDPGTPPERSPEPTQNIGRSSEEVRIAPSQSQSLSQSPSTSAPKVHEYPPEFEQWWTEYPRKQAKPDALKAFKAARKTTDLATLLAGVRTYKLLNIGQEKSHLKMPAGWLRDRRWEDEQVAHTPEQPRATVTHIGTSGVKECKHHPGYPAGDWMNPCVRCDEDAKRERGEAIF
ncbi:hypothetical protein A4X17_11380 [Plantibacter sp. H53]|uniref:hypothetical protein n=1 Tax=Plantibacter sp. H53 TaxID=1827323 RepID=UPI0007D906B3|nr:hypothetical protein [Plantibacter sp. H53]OAN35076.1 hypothetical protein A4X17_11380 [Plantibacter sp. H53]